MGRSMNGWQGIDVHNINIDFASSYTIVFSCADVPYSNRWMDVHTFPVPYYVYYAEEFTYCMCIIYIYICINTTHP